MNLAQATAALGEKDSERTLLLEEIQELEDLKATGCHGILRLSVLTVDGVETEDILVTFLMDGVQTAQKTLANAKTNSALPLKVKESELTIRVEVDGKVFDALLNVAEVPEDREMREELEAIGSEGKCAVLLKASYDNLATSLESKALQLEQLEKEFREIGNAVKEARKSQQQQSQPAKDSSGKKKKSKRIAEESIPNTNSAQDNSNANVSILEMVSMAAMQAINHRSFIAFGVAAVCIYSFGDYASV